MPHRISLFILGLITCTSAAGQEIKKVTYEDHVRPLLENKCFSCHNSDKKKGDLDLTNFSSLMTGGGGGEIVSAGNASASRLWTTCAKQEEPFMPPQGDALNAKELELLAAWITGGLLETQSSIAKKASQPKVDLTVTVASGRPEGPIARPEHVLLEPVVVTPRTNAVNAMSASPWTSLLALAGAKQILLYDIDSRQLAGILPYTEGYARSLRFSRNGSLLIMGGGRGGKMGHAVVWDVKTGERIMEIGSEFDQVMSADISPDHKRVVIGSPSKKVKCYDTTSGEELYTITKHTEWVLGTAFSPDGVLLATSDRNGNVMVWEAANGGEFYILGQHKSSCTDLAWRADSNILASCSTDGSIMIWEMNGGKKVKEWQAHGGGTQSIAFTPEGQLISAGNDGIVRLWDLQGNKKGEAPSQGDIVTKVASSHDSKQVISANWRGEVKLWSLGERMQELGTLSSNPPPIDQRITEAETVLSSLTAEGSAKASALAEAIQKSLAIATQVSDLKKRLNDAQMTFGQLEAELKDLPAKIAETQNLSTEAKNKRQAHQELIAQFETTVASRIKVEKELANLVQQRKAALENAQGNPSPEFDVAIAAVTEKLNPLKVQTANVPQPITEFEEAVKKVETQLLDLQQTMTEKQKQQAETAKQVEQLSASLPGLEKQLADATDVRGKAQAQVDEHQSKLAFYQKIPISLRAAKVNVGLLAKKTQLKQLTSELADFLSAKEQEEKARDDNSTQIASLNQNIAAATENIAGMEAEMSRVKSQIETATQALTTARAESASAQTLFDEKRAWLSTLRSELAKLIQSQADAVASVKLKAEEATTAILPLKAQWAAIAADLAAKEDRLKTLQDEGQRSVQSSEVNILREQRKQTADTIAEFEEVRADNLSMIPTLETDFAVKAHPTLTSITAIEALLPNMEKTLSGWLAKAEMETQKIATHTTRLDEIAAALRAPREDLVKATELRQKHQQLVEKHDQVLTGILTEIQLRQPLIEPLRAEVQQLEKRYFSMLP